MENIICYLLRRIAKDEKSIKFTSTCNKLQNELSMTIIFTIDTRWKEANELTFARSVTMDVFNYFRSRCKERKFKVSKFGGRGAKRVFGGSHIPSPIFLLDV